MIELRPRSVSPCRLEKTLATWSGTSETSSKGTPVRSRNTSHEYWVVSSRSLVALTIVSTVTTAGCGWVESGAGNGFCDPNQYGSSRSGLT